MTVIPSLNVDLSTHRTHACAHAYKPARKHVLFTRIPGCAEVSDKAARIFQWLKEYEKASQFFEVNSICFAAPVFSVFHSHLQLGPRAICSKGQNNKQNTESCAQHAPTRAHTHTHTHTHPHTHTARTHTARTHTYTHTPTHTHTRARAHTHTHTHTHTCTQTHARIHTHNRCA